jgi:uncharacterized membrane protein YeiH
VLTTDGRYLAAILAAGLVGLLFRRWVHQFTKVIAFIDALGLGAYTVVSIQKSSAAN